MQTHPDQGETWTTPQPTPTSGKQVVLREALALLQTRAAMGLVTYGQPLMTHNGRNASRDWIEECGDRFVYEVQMYLEHRDRLWQLDRLTALLDAFGVVFERSRNAFPGELEALESAWALVWQAREELEEGGQE